MAHPNIDARRERIAAILETEGKIQRQVRIALAAEFGCSIGAIAADIVALTSNAPASIHLTMPMRKRIYERDGRICQYCGTTDAAIFIIEHVIPAAMGGVARPYNLVVACETCNAYKRRSVWVPRNLDAITADHPEWRDRINALLTR